MVSQRFASAVRVVSRFVCVGLSRVLCICVDEGWCVRGIWVLIWVGRLGAPCTMETRGLE